MTPRRGLLAVLFLLLPALFLTSAFALEAAKESPGERVAAGGVRLFDTGTPYSTPIAPDALAKHDGWTQVPEDTTAHAFKGDAVLLNDKLALALRRSGHGAELYGFGAKGHTLRAVLTPTGAGRAAKLASLKIVENSPAGVGLDATFQSDDGKPLAVNLDLRMGQPFVRSEARGGAAGVRLEAPCRYAVLPDFFADDIVVSAAEVPVERAELPSEHFLLHLLGDGEAIAMAVWNVSQEDVQVALSGKGAERRLDASEIRFGDKGRVWAAVLEAPAIWHVHDVAEADAGKIVRLGWKPPYPAAWRLDWRRDDSLTGSWEMLLEKPGGYFEKPGWFGSPGRLPPDRKRWTTVLGSFQYPCWIDRAGEARIQPLKRGVTFQGPAVAYPISRVSATPLDAFTVVDIVRGTLGVGPCEYILDVEGQQSRNKGRATCSTRDTLGGIYAKKEQKKRRAEVEQVLVDVMAFIRYIRGRIEIYVDFGHGLLKYLASQKQAHPNLAQPIGELEALTKRIDAFVEARRSHIKTVDAAAALAEEFKKNVLDYDGPDALDRCKKITLAWVDIGGNQDELAGECRMAVKWVRQRAGLLMAADPRMADIAKEIRARTQKVLRSPAGHEGARH